MKPLLLTALFLVACGGTPVLEGPAPALAPAAPSAPPPSPERAPQGKLFRDEVERAVDDGFGVFLGKIKVEADTRDGKFTGWIVRALYPRDYWEGVDLAPGDIVTQVNDKPIERDNQAFEVFQSLKTAPTLRVSYLRDGAPRTLSFEIIPRPVPLAKN
ncbi:MAG: serine protease [Polyangiaceae bacterium]